MQADQNPQIELYVNAGTDEQNAAIEQTIASLEIEHVVKNTLQAAGIVQPVMLTLMITDDDTIRDMNKQYREQDKPTDVLSFPLLNKPLVNAPADQFWMTQGEGEAEASKGESAPVFVTP